MKQALVGKDKIKILGVASGPAREIQKLYEDHPDIAARCEVHLLDQDVEALKFSQRDILEICRNKKIKPNIQFHNLAIKNIINEGLPVGDFDLIYSAGLFDYFTDPVAQFAAIKLHQGLKPGGKLVIGNFNTNNPAQFIMEAIGDWYLIYRDEKQLTQLFSKVTPKLSIEKEIENVNLFAVMEK
jgi:extracellular factor (EF) 3-hydroxypalmitic acid methyl ester biosynthesis protein